jgi:hypothetical protein
MLSFFPFGMSAPLRLTRVWQECRGDHLRDANPFRRHRKSNR